MLFRSMSSLGQSLVCLPPPPPHSHPNTPLALWLRDLVAITVGSSMPIKDRLQMGAVRELFARVRGYVHTSSREKTSLHALASRLDVETEQTKQNTLVVSASNTQAEVDGPLPQELGFPDAEQAKQVDVDAPLPQELGFPDAEQAKHNTHVVSASLAQAEIDEPLPEHNSPVVSASNTQADTDQLLPQELGFLDTEQAKHNTLVVPTSNAQAEIDEPLPEHNSPFVSTSNTQVDVDELLPQELGFPDTEFTVFTNLPIELRRKVWKHTLPGPRHVKYTINSRRKITPLHHVCREARAEFFLYYKKLARPDGSFFYINPTKDTLFIDDMDFFALKLDLGINATILENLRHIVYPIKKLEDLIQRGDNYIIRERDPTNPRNFTMHAAAHFIDHIMDFSALETLTLAIVGPHDDQPSFNVTELFTTPILSWPVRSENVEFTPVQRQALKTPVFANWVGEDYLLEELQKAWYDTIKAVQEVLDLGEPGHAFKIEIKGLIEAADNEYVSGW